MAYQPIVNETNPLPPQYGGTHYGQVITTQPGHIQVYNSGDHSGKYIGSLVFNVIVAILCGLLSPITLCCSIPGIVFAAQAMNGSEMQTEDRINKMRISITFAVIAAVCGLLFTVGAILYYVYALPHNTELDA